MRYVWKFNWETWTLTWQSFDCLSRADSLLRWFCLLCHDLWSESTLPRKQHCLILATTGFMLISNSFVKTIFFDIDGIIVSLRRRRRSLVIAETLFLPGMRINLEHWCTLSEPRENNANDLANQNQAVRLNISLNRQWECVQLTHI